VDSVRKHKKFKQLASYGIQCLEKVIAPPRIGWEVNARAAFELGAAEDIADVCQRFASDQDVFTMSISSLNAMASVPKCLQAILAGEAGKAIVEAVKAYFAAIDFSQSSAAEGLSRLGPALELLLMLCRQDAAAFDRAGGIQMLLAMASDTSKATHPSMVNPASKGGGSSLIGLAYASVVTQATGILQQASKNRSGGLEALCTPASVAKLIAIATLNLAPANETKAQADARKSMKKQVSNLAPSKAAAARQTMTGRGGAAGAAAAEKAKKARDEADVNAHLDPAFRILDRVARTDTGRDLLQVRQGDCGCG
jgi:hypothetical protein